MLTLWGEINADGSIRSSGGGFSVSRQGTGQYVISFRTSFQTVPAVTGSPTNLGTLDQNTLDNVVFPFVNTGSTTVLTGDNNGRHQDRNFSFIAIGDPGTANPKFKE